jgi:hypothetical protein
MNLSIILLILRVLSALLLLGFLGLIAWLIYQDLKVAAATVAFQGHVQGQLRVVANESGNPAVDTMFPLLPVTTIGRAGTNTIVLPDGYASGQHALITRRDGQWWLEDQGSRNGTLLNEIPVQQAAVISAGDVISIGGTQLKIEY